MSDLESSSKKRRSFIWNHFFQTTEDLAKCVFCNSLLSTKGGSTTNLIRHVRTKHPAISLQSPSDYLQTVEICINENDVESTETATTEDNCREAKPSVFVIPQPTRQYVMPPVASQNANRLCPTQRNRTVEEQLLRLIVKDSQPFSIVESQEFRNFVNMLNPGYVLPPKSVLSTVLLPQLYIRTVSELKQHLSSAPFISVTVERWIGRDNDIYLAVVVHFINENFELRSCFLGYFRYSEKLSGQDLATEINNILLEWDVDDKVVTLVTTSAPNLREAASVGNWTHLPCFVDSVNLVAQAGIQQLKTIQAQVKSVIGYFKRSPKALGEFRPQFSQAEDSEMILKQDVPTKWNSTYEMFLQLLKLKELFTPLFISENPQMPTLRQQEWNVLEKACDCLKFFQEVITEVSATRSVSISKIILLSRALMKHCLKLKDDKNLPLEISKMLGEMIEQLTEEFSNIEENPVLTEATFLDPRFKKQGFHDEKAFEKTKQSVVEMASQIEDRKTEERKEAKPCKLESDTVWGEFDTKVAHLIERDNSTTASAIEVNKYLQEALLERKEDPLLWWFERRFTYQRLFYLIQKRLCIVATTVSCEKVFSKRCVFKSEIDTDFNAEIASQVAFLNYNLN